MPRPLESETRAELKASVGEGAWLESRDDLAPYTRDFRGLYQGVTPLVLLPRNASQVAAISGDLQSRRGSPRAPRRQHQLLRRRDPR